MKIIIIKKLIIAMTLLVGLLYKAQSQSGIAGVPIVTPTVSTFIQSVGGTVYNQPCDDLSKRYCYGYSINHGTWSEQHYYFGTSSVEAEANFTKTLQ